MPRLLPLTGLLLAAPVALATLPAASAAPPATCDPSRPAAAQQRDCPTTSAGSGTTGSAARVVVADIDSGINPYHERFQGGDDVTPAVLAEFDIPESQIIDLSPDRDLSQAVAKDFAGVERGKPYWFRGTNIIGISFDESDTPIMADEDDEHGTGTAASVLDANPDAIVVMVEGVADEDAESWAFGHEAVDVVTTSYGFPGSPPLGSHLVGSYAGVVENGKMHFGASDNSPALSPVDGTSGPWWSIGVAGFHEGSGGGRETLSGNVVDFLSDFTQDLPYCVDCRTGTRSVSGTSFATPRSAGTASKVLLEARRAAGHVGGPVRVGKQVVLVDGEQDVTTWDVRRALEEAAVIPSGSDYDPVEALVGDGGSLPVHEDAAYLQAGWGLLNPSVVEGALAQLAGAPPVKDADTCQFNLDQFDARVAYWDGPLAVSSESKRGSEAYVRCET